MAFLMLMLRSKIGAVLASAVVCVAVGAWSGYRYGSDRAQRLWDAEKARTAAGIIKSVEVQDARNNVAAIRYEVKREQRAGVFRSIRRNVDRLPVADCSLDDAGLRQWNDANAGGSTETAAGTDGAVSGDATESGERQPSGSAE